MTHDYELTNFKAFASSKAIPFRPITLIYGPNSSGKSSLLQSILLLKQTLDESEDPETLLLPKGKLVDLGGYREFIYRHEASRPFSIRLTQEVKGTAEGTIPSDIVSALGIDRLGIQITFAYDESAANAIVEEFAFFVDQSEKPVATFHRDPLPQSERERVQTRYSLRSTARELAFRGKDIDTSHPFWRRVAEVEQQYLSRYYADDMRTRLKTLRDQLKQLQDFESAAAKMEDTKKKKRRVMRALPDKSLLAQEIDLLEGELAVVERPWEEVLQSYEERHRRTYMALRNFLPTDVEIVADMEEENISAAFHHRRYLGRVDFASRTYSFASQLLRKFLGDLVYLGPLRESPERHYVFSGNVTGQVGKTGRLVPDVLFKNRALLKQVNQQLTSFNIGYQLMIAGSGTGELSDVFSLRLVDSTTKVNASILDVGFGISQVLPVIVQSMLSTNKTLCIEQPEIHLHPRLQAELGSLLVACIQKPYNNRFIIETHSQHLILRLQRLIREGKLSRSDVAVLYVDKDMHGSRCLELRLDQDGDFIDEWPHGFFEEGYQEIFAT